MGPGFRSMSMSMMATHPTQHGIPLFLKKFIYVADSAAMNQDTLQAAIDTDAFLLSRAPNRLKIVKQALKTAETQPSAWSSPFTIAKSKKGAIYRVQEQSATYYGHDLRLVVVESSALDQKKRHTLEKRRDKTKNKPKPNSKPIRVPLKNSRITVKPMHKKP